MRVIDAITGADRRHDTARLPPFSRPEGAELHHYWISLPPIQFSFELFYRRLSDKGFIIYPGKLTQVNTFRIGTIGRLFEGDIRGLLAAIRETLDEMGVKILAHLTTRVVPARTPMTSFQTNAF